MIFDIKEALSLPAIRDSEAKRSSVLGRFGPLFRDPTHLTQQDYLDFLSIKYNHHWTGLERLGRSVADDMGNLRRALAILVDETSPLSKRFDETSCMLRGVGPATLTPILLLAYPDRYGVWNGTSEREMRDRDHWPTFSRGASDGEKYEVINSVLLKLAANLSVHLWTLDALWWMSKLERENSGRYKDARFNAIWYMADQAEQTAKQSNGQAVERITKNKDLRLSKEALIKHLVDLLNEKGDCCAISGLALNFEGPDEQLRPSLDRIDSDGHYEAGNLQVVARFINRWKSNSEDCEFRRLLALVRTG